MSVSNRAVLKNMSDGVVVLDAQNRIAGLNPAAQRLIGHAASEVVGQPVEQVRPGWPIQKHHRGATEVVREVTMHGEDGPRTYDMRASPVFDWLGRLVSRVVVLHDVPA